MPPEGLVIRADRDKILQVLLNLLTNAVKYNRDGGEVLVEADDSPDVSAGPDGDPDTDAGRAAAVLTRSGCQSGAVDGWSTGGSTAQQRTRIRPRTVCTMRMAGMITAATART